VLLVQSLNVREDRHGLTLPARPKNIHVRSLAAKESSIPAGEADRLITRGGGRVGVIRRPSEPSQ